MAIIQADNLPLKDLATLIGAIKIAVEESDSINSSSEAHDRAIAKIYQSAVMIIEVLKPFYTKIEARVKRIELLQEQVFHGFLPARIANCLWYAGIETIGELTMLTENDLLVINGIAEGSVATIKAALEKYGLTLRSEK